MSKTPIGKDGLIPGEYTWKNWEKLPVDKFIHHVGTMLNFYNSHTTKSDLKRDVLEWMKHNEYTKDQIAAVRASYENTVSFTAAKIARALNVGMPESHPDIPKHYSSTVGCLKNDLAACKKPQNGPETAEKEDPNDQSENPTPKISPAERLQNKVETTVIQDLSVMMDEWIVMGDNKVKPLDIVKSIKTHDIPVKGLSTIRTWLERWLKEVEAARDKTESDLAEGYSYLNKRGLNAWCKNISTMIAELDKYESKQKTARKNARKSKSTQKKQTAAQIAKKVANVKYQEKAEITSDLFLGSIQPIEILGRLVLYTYNTKYRRFSCYTAQNRDGLTVAGTTVKNFDPENSYSVTLRKPEQILRLFSNLSVTQTQVENAMKNVKCKRSVPNGRINQNTLLLISYQNKDS